MPMTDPWILMVIIMGCLAGGFLLGGYIARLRIKSAQDVLHERERQLGKNLELTSVQLQEARELSQRLQLEKERQGQELVRRQAEVEKIQEKYQDQKKEILELQDTFTKEFENLANTILRCDSCLQVIKTCPEITVELKTCREVPGVFFLGKSFVDAFCHVGHFSHLLFLLGKLGSELIQLTRQFIDLLGQVTGSLSCTGRGDARKGDQSGQCKHGKLFDHSFFLQYKK